MVLKKKEIDLEGIKVKIKQFGFASQMRTEALGDKKNNMSPYLECLENKEVLEELTIKQGLEMVKQINILNDWESKDEDFQKPTPESGTLSSGVSKKQDGVPTK